MSKITRSSFVILLIFISCTFFQLFDKFTLWYWTEWIENCVYRWWFHFKRCWHMGYPLTLFAPARKRAIFVALQSMIFEDIRFCETMLCLIESICNYVLCMLALIIQWKPKSSCSFCCSDLDLFVMVVSWVFVCNTYLLCCLCDYCWFSERSGSLLRVRSWLIPCILVEEI